MSQDNAETVRKAFDHLNRGDVEGLVGLCADDFVMDMSERVFNPDTYEGADGIRRFFAGVRNVWRSYQWHVRDALATDDCVVAMLHCEAEGKEAGVRVDWDVAWLWRLRQGTPVSVRFYRDPERALEAAGLRE